MDRWVRRRQGHDSATVTLNRRRIYILPTSLGVVFAVMVVAMLVGSLNYGNNLGLALTFLLIGLGLVAMHQCHGTLDGLVISAAGVEPPFAGEEAEFRFELVNPSQAARYDLEVDKGRRAPQAVALGPGERAAVIVRRTTTTRGTVRLVRCEIATRFPFGLFRAWAVLHPDLDCVVYPRPAGDVPLPPALADAMAGHETGRGEEDFVGLKDYHPGDPPRHIAWKALAHGGELLVKEFAGSAVANVWLDFADAPGADVEQRLAVLARWVVEAHAAGRPFGLRLPGIEFPPAPGEAQRRRCLAALAGFDAPEAVHV